MYSVVVVKLVLLTPSAGEEDSGAVTVMYFIFVEKIVLLPPFVGLAETVISGTVIVSLTVVVTVLRSASGELETTDEAFPPEPVRQTKPSVAEGSCEGAVGVDKIDIGISASSSSWPSWRGRISFVAAAGPNPAMVPGPYSSQVLEEGCETLIEILALGKLLCDAFKHGPTVEAGAP